jgi:DNA (cytosine-5)-methyltransferase 1
MRVLSLCSGYGGLDLAVQAVFPEAHPVAFAEYEAAPSKVLAHHWPNVPNLHDITAVDWDRVGADILTAGYPCQPFSMAGARKGTDDHRHLWPFVAEAGRRTRPRLVLLENVSGHLSMGFGDVLGDLAALGYVGGWRSVRASDVGAPHQRERVFILAVDADSDGRGWAGRPDADIRQPGGHAARLSEVAAADAENVGHQRGRSARDGRAGPADGGAPTADAQDDGPAHGVAGGYESQLAGAAGGGLAAADSAGIGWGEGRAESAGQLGGSDAAQRGASTAGYTACKSRGVEHGEPAEVDWGAYEPAIRRWERVLGRAAPAPTERGPKGGARLSPYLVEWMMGLPPGHVTAVPGLSRNEQLKMLGNGVVPQQAAFALRLLVDDLALVAA